MFLKMLSVKVLAVIVFCCFLNINSFAVQENAQTGIACQRPAFTGSRISKTFAPSFASAAADFNNDGKPDIVNFHTSRATLTIQLNLGNGYFGEPQIVNPEGQFGGFRFTTGDFNNDGFEDLLTATRLIFGDGRGGFSAPQTTGINPNLSGFRVGDFNGDDNLDVAGFENSDNTLVAYLGDGFGGFSSAGAQMLTGQYNYYEIADLNNDAISDVVIVLSNANTVSVVFGNEEGTFEAPVNYPLGGEGTAAIAAVGDIDNNGTPDILASSNGFGGGETFSVPLLNDGNGNFTVQPRFTEPTANIRRIYLFDINSDGNLDYLATFAGSFFARFGNGNGTFQPSRKSAAIFSETELLFEDFTGDGITDLGFGSSDIDDFTVLVNDENGNLGAKQFPVTGYSPLDVATADFNSDNKPDIVTANNSNELSVSLGDGNGGFNAPTSIPLSRNPRFVLAADINADGKTDIIALTRNPTNYSGLIAAYLGNGNGTFSAPIETVNDTIALARKPVFADLNGDQYPDLIIPGGNEEDVVLFRGSENGGFGRILNIQIGGNALSVAAGDYNRDGSTDLAVLTFGSVQIYLGDGNWRFDRVGIFPARSANSQIFTTDFNNDGNLDLAVTTEFVGQRGTNGFVGIMLGTGTGGFRASREYPVGRGPGPMSAADFDGDGNIDLAVTNIGYTDGPTFFDNRVSVLYGSGAGDFPRVNNYTAANRAQGIAVDDFNSDGKPDIVTGEFASDFFVLLTNICLPAPLADLPDISVGGNMIATEGDAAADVTVNVPVTLSEAAPVAVSVEYYTAPQNGLSEAQRPQSINGVNDYLPKSGRLVFQPGETTKNVALTIRGDLIDEFDEKFLLLIADATNAVITDNKSEITITDNDAPPSISIGNVSSAEGGSGTTAFEFPVTLSAASEKPISVNYLTGGGTATAGIDYARAQGTLTIAAGAAQGVISVIVNGDLAIEPDETFFIEIRDPVNVLIGNNRATGTIINDDQGGEIFFSGAAYTTNEGTIAGITINRVNGTGGGASVRVRTQAGTATPGQDYTEVNRIVTFADDQTQSGINIAVNLDQLDEGAETVNIIIEDPVNATIGTPATAVLTIQDIDDQPNVSISDASVIEGDSGTVAMAFAVNLSRPSKLPVSVNFSTADDTATAGIDYLATTGTFTVEPGATRALLEITINGDLVREPDETFFVNLSNPVNAVLTDNQALGRIINDEVNPSAGTTELVSINFMNSLSGNSDSVASDISDDGNLIVFESFANDLVENDFNGFLDVFVRDMRTGQTRLVSLNQSGTTGGNCPSRRIRISGNGRFAAFNSCATNLTGDPSAENEDSIFLRDLQTDQTRLVTVNSNGQKVNGTLQDISNDGRFIAFTSRDQNVSNVPDVQNFNDVFVRDMQQNVTLPVSVNAAGTGTGNADSSGPGIIGFDVNITPDGRFVIYPSLATNLVPQPSDGQYNIFVRDLQNQTTIPVSVNAGNTQLVGADLAASISDDGKYAFFATGSGAVVANDTNNTGDVFRRDLQTNTSILVSINRAGTGSGNGSSIRPYVSADGRYAVFESVARNLSEINDTNQVPDIYWRDIELGITKLLSINNSDSDGGNQFSSIRDISSDGQTVLFSSAASNLVSPSIDINQNFDLFIRDLRVDQTFVASINNVGTSVGNAPTTFGTLSANGNVVAYESYSTNLVPNDNPNGVLDIFAFTKALPDPPLFDFDGDGKTDLSVFRPSNSVWYILNSLTGSFRAQQFGNSTDIPAADDYDGDGQTDIAVYREGVWYIYFSRTNNFGVFSFGQTGDQPVNADFDGDGKADLAVFRPSTGQWYIRETTNQEITRVVQFGMAGDETVPADFDGDGKTDIAVFRSGVWYILQSSDGTARIEQFGISADKTAQGDFDGDGKADLAIFRPSNSVWYVKKSDNSGFIITQFGISSDIPLRGDFDADGKADIAVFRDGVWYILQSSDGNVRIERFGLAGDLAIPQ